MGLRHFRILFIWLPVLANGQSFHPLVSNYEAQQTTALIATINTDLGAGDYFKIPTKSTGSYNCMVDWGDESTSELTSWDDPDTTHYYSVGGIYTVTITGTFTAWSFNNGGDKDKLINFISFGETGLNDISYGFQGCGNVTGAIPTFPETLTNVGPNAFRNSTFTSVDLTGITYLNSAIFSQCYDMTGDILIPESVTSIGNNCFEYSGFDGDLIINSVDNSLPGTGFARMYYLDNIYLNNTSLSLIGAFCFYLCQISGNIYLQASTAPTVATNGLVLTLTGSIHVPVGASGYDVEPWSNYTVVYDQ